MKRALRGAWRSARTVVHGLHGLAIVLFRFPSLDLAARRARVQWWSAKLLATMGVQLQVEGHPRAGANLIVANHVSWLDIAAIHAAAPHARFVSKADVQKWPILNRLIDAAGTLYIQRERTRDALRVVHQMAEALKAGDTVAVFPEGTTSDGTGLLPFHANLLQAAIATGTPVQPVALRFSDACGPVSAEVTFIGETTLAQSFWRIACAEDVKVRVKMLTALATPHADRRALAVRLHDEIAAALD